jgi:hypothetical protein
VEVSGEEPQLFVNSSSLDGNIRFRATLVRDGVVLGESYSISHAELESVVIGTNELATHIARMLWYPLDEASQRSTSSESPCSAEATSGDAY